MIQLARHQHFGVVIVAVVCGMTSACKQSGTKASDSTAPSAAVQAATEAATGKKDSVQLPVIAEEARDGDLVLRVNTTGLIRSDAIVRLSAEVGGVAAQVPVRA